MNDFTSLYRRYAPDVYRFALYLSGEHGEAEDITSETFVRLWASGDRLQMSTLKAYLFTIARNLFLQGVRKKSRNVELDQNLRDARLNPEMQAVHKTELEHVMSSLQQLPEIDRAALLMRALDELPYNEIAVVLGISLTAAKVKVHRARLALAGLTPSKQTGIREG